MKFATRLALVSMSLVMMTAMSARAQMAWGTGQAMGQQACPYDVRAGNGASSYLDEVREAEKALSEEKKKLRKLEGTEKQLKRELSRLRKTIEGSIQSEYAAFILNHMDNGLGCNEYKNHMIVSGKNPDGTTRMDEKKDVAPESGAQSDLLEPDPFSSAEWQKLCIRGKDGGVNGNVCKAKASNKRKGRDLNECAEAVSEYSEKASEYSETKSEIADTKELIKRYEKEDIPRAREDAVERYREARERGATEGDFCENCYRQGAGYVSRGTDWANVFANLAVGVGLTWYGGQLSKDMYNTGAQHAANLGATFPVQPYPAIGFGLPFLMNGFYGATMGGTGAGGFGCAGGYGGAGYQTGPVGAMGPNGMGPGLYGNVGMNGAYGYPYGINGMPPGGGMYAGGMYPGMMPGMYPGMYPGGGINGGIYGGINGGIPGMYPGMPYPGGGINGGIYGGIPGMYPGMPGMPGMPYPGMPYPGGGINGGIYGGIPGMYPGMPGMPGMYDPYGMNGGALGGAQYQQAMMQMQMQQYQMYMQQQQQAMQSAMVRQQTLTGLYGELQALQMKIQQVQMGGNIGYIGGGGSVGFGGSIGFGGGGYYGGGYNNGGVPAGILPAPGSPTTMPYPNNNNTVPGGIAIPAGSNR